MGLLDFEGASKKNKPNIDIGSYVYCRVLESNKYLRYLYYKYIILRILKHINLFIFFIKLRPKLTCINPNSKKEWTSGEAFFGELKDGYC